MANKIILKRASQQGKIPLVTDLDLGELAINTRDGRLFAKKDDGSASIIDLKQNDPIRVLGDASSTYAWDQGTYTSNVTVTLNTVNGNVGTFGGKAGGTITVPIVTVNDKGLVTGVTTTTYSAASDLGTMSTQNSSNVTITGGTIDGTVIGGTTPAAGSFTSLTTTGDVTVGGNLTVSGTTTTVNSTTVSVGDLNIELAKDATNKAQANGGGLTVKLGTDGNATLVYASATDSWDLNKNVNVTGNIAATADISAVNVITSGGVTATGNISALNGTFTGDVSAVNGTFSTNVSVTGHTSTGTLNAGATTLGSTTVSGVSATRVVFGGTGGVLSSDSDLTYNSTSNTLTLVNLAGTTANLSSTLDVSGQTTLKSTVSLTSTTAYTLANYSTGALQVAGDSSFASNIQVQSDIRAAGTIYKGGYEVLNTQDTIDGGTY